ncbi:MAG: ZIP family metal transporter, partial [Patescibacteria group bacterium]
EEGHPHAVGTMSLIGDLVHNCLDGIVIGASFLVSIQLGIITTIAIILHEIPQEIGDFGLLLHSGYTRNKALLLNFLVGLTAIIGTIITLITGSNFENITKYILPITAGGFLYMATVDLIPELKEEAKFKNIALQFITMILGITVMYLMLFLE